MRVFVAGATGAIGRPLLLDLRRRGHEAVALSRSAKNDAVIRERGGDPVRGDLFDVDALARAMAGCDAVVRVATHIPADGRAASSWATNDRIRREGTRALLAAATRAGVRRYVQESIVWVARPEDGSRFDERSPPRPDRITQSALDAERIAEGSPVIAATLRLGWLYGADTALGRQFAQLLRNRRLPVLGDGSARICLLHADDAARAFVDAIESGARGTFHVVDDEPAPVGDFFDEMARRVGAPRPRRVPRWIGALTAGSHVARFLTTPMVTSHEPFTRASGWKPAHATYREGLAELSEARRPSSS